MVKIEPISGDFVIKLALVAVGLGVLWYGMNKATGAATAAAAWVGETADNVIAAPILGAGDIMGIPRTSQSQCDLDTAAGDTWAASFSCPAKRFIGYVTGTTPPANTGGATGSW